jgi:GT2 family glycosyltransferase
MPQIGQKTKKVAVDIIMVSDSNNEELKSITEKALDSLFSSEEDIEFFVYLVESSSFAPQHPNIKVISPDPPFNYHKYLNKGRRLGSSEFVCLVNNDVVFQKGWASNIISAMEKYPEILSMSPRDHKREKEFPDVVLGYRIGRILKGWCIFQKRRIYEIIGEMAEEIPFYCCDNLYALQLQKHGLQHAEVGNSSVEHEIGVTYKKLDIPEKIYCSLYRGRELLKKHENRI